LRGVPSHVHTVALRVRFGETDAMGVANNGVYLGWLEVARIEYLRSLGHSYRDVHNQGFDLVVAEARVQYRKPLQFDDEFEIECVCSEVGRATVTFAYEVRSADGVHAVACTRHACVSRQTLRPTRIPGWLIDAVSGST
jgi:acyl-CoA thioester hydrolase